MKHVVFVVGPALGHVARSFVIARALSSLADYSLSFCVVSPGYGEKILSPEFPCSLIPANKHDKCKFADHLEISIEQLKPDLICLDMNPHLWLTQVKFPDIPTVFITNFFLTKPWEYNTDQTNNFRKDHSSINEQRERRGLSPIVDIKNLYSIGHVLLCDPPPLITSPQALPDNYTITGPCFWEPNIELPDSLTEVENSLFVSFGSTGKKPIPSYIIDELASAFEINDVIWVGGAPDDAKCLSSITHHVHSWLPASEVIKRSRFVITQGGAGSTYQTLAHGRPCGVWPTLLNQNLLGQIVERYGCGLLLNDALPSCESLHDVISVMEERSRNIADKLATIDGPKTAAAKIVELLNA